MIAAVKGWPAVLAALLFFLPRYARSADDPAGAARELAQKTAAYAGRGALVEVTWRNIASLDPATGQEARAAFEAALQESGAHVGDVAPAVEAQITFSENESQYLMVEESRKGEERQVWIAFWKRDAPRAAPPQTVALEKKLVWEQNEAILDVAFPAAGLLVLTPGRVTLYKQVNGNWEASQPAAVTPAQPWPRDPRGRLRTAGKTFQAFLPGMACSGATEPALATECRATDEPWLMESGSPAPLRVNFAAGRNYFDGRVTTPDGVHETVPPFYSAASVEDQGRTWWVLAQVDGRSQIFDAAFQPAGIAAQRGSDVAGTRARCGGASQAVATRPGDRSDPDTLQAFSVVNGSAATVTTAAVEFPGPITALWTSGADSVLAVAHDLRTGRYAAYLVTVVCGR
jgi:hypothetical protein